MTEEEIEKIVEKAYAETKILYKYQGSFFSPKLKHINYMEVGRSKIIQSWYDILLEWIYAKLNAFGFRYRNWKKRLFPRRNILFSGHIDSSLVGQLLFAEPEHENIPIHNMHLEFWGRTRFYQWRKFGECSSDENGKFRLEFSLVPTQAWILKSTLHFEIYQTTDILCSKGKMIHNQTLFKTISIKKSDLIGMEYNLRIIRLFLWQYRQDSIIPRVYIKPDGTDAPEEYPEGRVRAMTEQMIPIELTKIEHLMQIEEDPHSLTIADIQRDYPKNLTVAIEEKIPGYTRGDDWFGIREMNGMNMSTFLPDPTTPGEYWVKYFGACNYEVNEEYAFPTAEIKFRLKENGLPAPMEIHLTGPLNRFNKDPFQKIVVTASDGEKWLQAKRVARVTSALCAELDQHLAGTHLNTEQYSIAAHRNIRKNPVITLLMPHVKSVSLIDNTADKLLIQGYIPSATALTVKSTEKRACDLLGFQDWKGWKPMKVLSDAHLYAKAEELYWQVVTEWVDLFFSQHETEIKKEWLEIYRMSEDLVAHAVPLFSATIDWDKLKHDEKDFTRRRIEYLAAEYRMDLTLPRKRVNGKLKAVSPITDSTIFREDSDDWQNLKDMCRYVITTATFLHTWVNEHQYEDIGEVLYSCLGLRFGEKETGIMAPESDVSIAPDATRSTQMMWFSNLLSRTEYGFILQNEQKDMHPEFMELLRSKKKEFAALKVNVEEIESRTNI